MQVATKKPWWGVNWILTNVFLFPKFYCTGTIDIDKNFLLVIFPMDILERGLAAKNFAMLGLGDIVIPGNSSFTFAFGAILLLLTWLYIKLFDNVSF